MPTVDVIVIGAGVAGLSCAYRLALGGATVVVFEARNRIGGRIWTLRMPELAPVELGAQVVHGNHSATWDVIRLAGLSAAPLKRSGDLRIRVQGKSYTISQLLKAGIQAPWQVELELPWREVADRSAAAVLRSYDISELSRVMALEWLAQIWAADPAGLSVAGMRSVKDAWRAGRGEFVVLDGYDRIPQRLAAGLDVRVSAPVERVYWQRGRVRLRADGESWSAPAAVISVPPAVVAAGGLRFEPSLPNVKMLAVQAIPAGDAVSVVLRLTQPAPDAVWGFVVDAPAGFWRVDAGSYVVRGWIKGPSARHARSLLANTTSLAEIAARVLPWLRPAIVQEAYVADWGADPYALGAFSSPRLGALQQPARWAEPQDDTLFFAGEATCGDRHPAMVHGAMESGARVAREVLQALGGRSG